MLQSCWSCYVGISFLYRKVITADGHVSHSDGRVSIYLAMFDEEQTLRWTLGLRAVNPLKTQCSKNFILLQLTVTITLNKAFMKYLGIQNFLLWQSQEIMKRPGFFSPTFVWSLPGGHKSFCDHLERFFFFWFCCSPASLAKVEELHFEHAIKCLKLFPPITSWEKKQNPKYKEWHQRSKVLQKYDYSCDKTSPVKET